MAWAAVLFPLYLQLGGDQNDVLLSFGIVNSEFMLACTLSIVSAVVASVNFYKVKLCIKHVIFIKYFVSNRYVQKWQKS